MKHRHHLAVLLLAFAAIACRGPEVHLAEVDVDMSQYEIVGDAEGRANGIEILGLVPIKMHNRIERAVQDAIAEMGGDEMVNITVEESGAYFFVVSFHKIVVRGTVLKRL